MPGSSSVPPFSAMKLHSGRVLGGANASSEVRASFQLWHKSVESRDLNKMKPKFDESCVFHSPTVSKPFSGPDALGIILESVGEVFGDSLSYHRQWISDDGRDWALEFTAVVGPKKIKIKGVTLSFLSFCS